MAAPATAVLLVHGIGSQRVGETAAKLTAGLRRAFPDVEADVKDGSGTIRVAERTVHVYEVWWADLLDGDDVRGSFNILSLHELAWLPWLNWRAGVIPRRRVTAVAWTCLLAPLVFLLQLAYLVSVVFPRARRVLDEHVADVLNYVDSADRDLPPSSPLAEVAERIEARVAQRLHQAVAGGAEDVVVVAHSLGSVIAYRTLMRGLADGADERWTRVSALITIGSPLNTFSLVWPRLVAPVGDAPVPAVEWDNVHDRLDPVAAKIKHIRAFSEPVHEHVVSGRAGFALAHTRYEQQPVFLKVLSERLNAPPASITVTPSERVELFARSVLECFGVVAGALVALVVGATVALAAGALVALVGSVLIVVGTMLDNYSAWRDAGWTFGGTVRVTFAGLMVLAFLVAPLIAGRVRARRRHYAHVHNMRPDLAGVGEGIPDPPAWMTAIAMAAGAVLGVAFTVAIWWGTSIPTAWDAGVGPIARALLVLAYAFGGGFGAVLGLCVVGGTTWGWYTWRQYRTATGQSPQPPA